MILERMRAMNRMLQTAAKVTYAEVATILGQVLEANVYIGDREGGILGFSLQKGFECDVMLEKVLQVGCFPERYVEWLLRATETLPNVRLKESRCAFSGDLLCKFSDKFTTILPMYGCGERSGTLIVAKFEKEFTEADLVLAEYAAVVVGLKFLRDQNDRTEEIARKKAIVQMAFGTLSYSEQTAMRYLLREIEGNEGLLIASRIADQKGFTRSVIVNALRKLGSAGVLESQSLGMKGTYVRITNEYLMAFLEKLSEAGSHR